MQYTPPTPLPDTDFPDGAGSNILPNIVSENEITGFVEGLVRLQAEAAGDDSFWISVVPPKMGTTTEGVPPAT